GYIGSHVVRVLVEQGYQVVVLDNFSTGHPGAVPKEAVIEE
ncbi:MAG TPA: UDP-glucose 4-epimerase GalE, partial [Acetobacterium sp.]|nr:UDP-glucose 4-epimerase GalE [Acetobacterium sp.]